MHRRLARLAALAASVLLVTAAGRVPAVEGVTATVEGVTATAEGVTATAEGVTATAEGVTATVKAGELYFDPKTLDLPAGEVTFTVVNEGAIEHNFVVRDARGATVAEVPVIAPGATARVSARLAPGSYRIVCSYPGHTEAGMAGTLTVK